MNNLKYTNDKEDYIQFIQNTVNHCDIILAITLTYKNYNCITHKLMKQNNDRSKSTNLFHRKSVNPSTKMKRYKVYGKSKDQVKKDARHFKNVLDSKLYGKQNGRINKRAFGCLVVEGSDTN